MANDLTNTLREMPTDKTIRLYNVICVYCGSEMSTAESTKEHVIGRRFVPKGKLAGQWNLIVNACRSCNSKKSDLEDDLSAISLHPDIFGRYGHEDDVAIAEAKRKAQNSISRRTSSPVGKSNEQISFNVPFGVGANMKFNMTGPPQADTRRVFELARFQLMAFYFLITYAKEARRGYWWTGGYHPVSFASRADWGNALHRSFMENVLDWEPRVMATGADGFFKILIRRHPTEECWSWVLEWNCSMRVIGFLGDRDVAQQIVDTFERPNLHTVQCEGGGCIRFREDVPIDEKEDIMFYWPG